MKFASSSIVFIVGEANGTNVIFKSFDAGQTWTDFTQNLPSISSIPVSTIWQNESIGWVLFQNGNVIRTLDGGLSWVTRSVQANGNNMNSIGISK